MQFGLKWMDANGRTWSTDKNDRSYYDVDKQAYCINLSTPPRVEGQITSVFNQWVSKVDADTIANEVDKAVRRFYSAGRR